MGDGHNPAPLSNKSIMFEMMDITEQLSKIYNVSPFDVLDRDAEHVIMVINYVLEKSNDAPKNANTNIKPKQKHKDDFWDF